MHKIKPNKTETVSKFEIKLWILQWNNYFCGHKREKLFDM